MMKRKRNNGPDADAAGEEPATSDEGSAVGGQGSTGGDGDAATSDEGPSLQDQLAETHERWLRTAAEMENIRRRGRLDVEEARKYGLTPLLTELLDVLDALQRALVSAPTDENDPLRQGLLLTEQQFLAVLGRHGVTIVDSQPGQATDPAVHRVLVEQPGTGHEPGRIVTEITRGYRVHDRLLREAQVAVAARAPTPAAPEDGDDADV